MPANAIGTWQYNLAINTNCCRQVQASNAVSMVQANDGARWHFKVKPFSKIYPRNASRDLPSSVTLTWTNLGFVKRYKYCIDTSSNNLCNGSRRSAGTAYRKTLALKHGKAYYWKVRAIYPNRSTYYSPPTSNTHTPSS